MLTRNPAINQPATVFRGWLRASTVQTTRRSMACREIGQNTDFVDRQVSPAPPQPPWSTDSSPALQRPSKAAIALVPVLAFFGAAVNYSRAVQARTSLQVALNSAALMVSKEPLHWSRRHDVDGGHPHIASSTAAWGNTRTRMAMVLDNRIDGSDRQNDGDASRGQGHDRHLVQL